MKLVQQAFLPPAIRMPVPALAPFLELVSQACQFTLHGLFIPALSRFGDFVPQAIQSSLNAADFVAAVAGPVVAIIIVPLSMRFGIPKLELFELTPQRLDRPPQIFRRPGRFVALRHTGSLFLQLGWLS